MASDGYELDWLRAEQHGGGRSHILQALAELRQRHGIRGQRVLELGSGLGTNLLVLAEHNRVQGVEALEGAVQLARAAGVPTERVDLAVDALPWPAGAWDWILMLDVLEHLVAPEHVLAEARRLLSAQGRIVVNVPNCFDWRCRWRLLQGGGVDSARHFPGVPAWRYPHLRFFRHADLLALLRDAGFEPLEDLSGTQASLPKARHWPRVARRIATAWPDLAASGFFVVAKPA